MRLAFQIFRKDAERLWWAILLTLALQVVFVFQDTAQFVYAFPPRTRPLDWMSLAVPFAWSLLIALVILQDPLTGDRQFWVALPSGWRPLAIAKAAFIAAFIQLPYFLATSVILALSGFNPLQHLPHLLWKQLALLALVTPVVAVAAVVKNFAQFMLVPISVIAGLLFLSGGINNGSAQNDSWDMRWPLALIVLGAGAAAVIAVQWKSRRTILSRTIAVIVVIAAACVYNWLPRDVSAAIDAALSPSPADVSHLSVSPVSPDDPHRAAGGGFYTLRQTTLTVPIAYSGLRKDVRTRFDQVSLELVRPDGARFAATWPRSQEEYRKTRIRAFVTVQDDDGRSVLVIQFVDPSAWNSVKDGSVTIRGRMLANFYRSGPSATLRANVRTDVGGLVNCMAFRSGSVPQGQNSYPVPVLECNSAEESPDDILGGHIGGWNQPRAGYLQRQNLWLSPLMKSVSFSAGWPLDGQWNITPMNPVGMAVVDYSIPNVDLNAYVMQDPAKPEAAK